MKAIQMTEQVHAYVIAHGPAVNSALPRLAQETRTLPSAGMQIAPDQGALMHLLAKLVNAKRILEVGCFTGYSSICMAQALAPGGKLITLDVNPTTTAVAKRYWVEAGVADRIELHLGPALETLPTLQAEYGLGSFDMMFIDADKGNMPEYYEWGLKLVRQGGLILLDNVLWGGSVLKTEGADADTRAIQAVNEKVRTDERVDRVMIGISDGIYVCRKR